jgi:TRAP transporter TAXI family solute receptor
MNKRQFFLTGIAAAIAPAALRAQGVGAAKAVKPIALRVATGPGSGVYTKFFANIQKVAPEVELVEVQTAGASANLGILLKLDAEIGFMQADYLWAAWKLEGKDEVYENIRTIMPLYGGSIHMIATDESIQKFSDLAGKRIGTFGGGAVTLRVMMAKAGLTGTVTNFSKEDRPEVIMMQALRDRKIDVAVGIGGEPVPWVATVNTPKGLQIPGAHLVKYDRWNDVKDLAVGQEKGFYKLRTLDYANMSGTAQSLSVVSLLVSARNWGPSAPETLAIQALYKAITTQLQKLKDRRIDENFHPAWIEVNPMRDPTWPWYGNLKPAGRK